jgi:DnaJ family protein B protein 4
MLILEALVGKTLDMTTLDGRDIAIQVTDIVKPAYELVDSLMKVCHLQRILSNTDN